MHNLIGGFQQNVFHGDPRLLQRFIDAVEGILFHQGHRDIHISVILLPQIFQQPGARSFPYSISFSSGNTMQILSCPSRYVAAILPPICSVRVLAMVSPSPVECLAASTV